MPPDGKTTNSDSPLDQAIVAFIDILGYSELVKRLINDFDRIKGIEDVLEKASVGLIEAMRSKLSVPEPYLEYYKKLVQAIDVRFISDTILVTLHLAKTEVPFPDFNQDERLFHCIHVYLRHICMFSTMFTGKTGLVLRGGISMGPHYENQHDSSLFIFSQAYLDACKLEKKAHLPRILIDKKLFLYFKSFPLHEIDNFFYDGDTEEKCLDIYAHFKDDAASHSILNEIKRGLCYNLMQSRGHKRFLENLLDFARYHNRKAIVLGFDDVLINISKIEEYYRSL